MDIFLIPTKGHIVISLQLDCGWFGFVLVNRRDAVSFLFLPSVVHLRWSIVSALHYSCGGRECGITSDLQLMQPSVDVADNLCTNGWRQLTKPNKNPNLCIEGLLRVDHGHTCSIWLFGSPFGLFQSGAVRLAYTMRSQQCGGIHLFISYSIGHKVRRSLNLTDGRWSVECICV